MAGRGIPRSGKSGIFMSTGVPSAKTGTAAPGCAFLVDRSCPALPPAMNGARDGQQNRKAQRRQAREKRSLHHIPPAEQVTQKEGGDKPAREAVVKALLKRNRDKSDRAVEKDEQDGAEGRNQDVSPRSRLTIVIADPRPSKPRMIR